MLPVLTLTVPPTSRESVTVAAPAERRRDPVYRAVTRLLSVAFLPVAFAFAPRRARRVACRWALRARFPAQDFDGLTPAARASFEAARTDALWHDGELIGHHPHGQHAPHVRHDRVRLDRAVQDDDGQQPGAVALELPPAWTSASARRPISAWRTACSRLA